MLCTAVNVAQIKKNCGDGEYETTQRLVVFASTLALTRPYRAAPYITSYSGAD